MKQPETITMHATPIIEAAGDEKELPRFRMVAYSGGPMQIAGFSHPVVVDLAGLDIPSQNLPIRRMPPMITKAAIVAMTAVVT